MKRCVVVHNDESNDGGKSRWVSTTATVSEVGARNDNISNNGILLPLLPTRRPESGGFNLEGSVRSRGREARARRRDLIEAGLN